ncbi:hypothetical protein PN836_019260 [Ningiella sp. W23]|uniref:hypothetical protein n=1 Tax=Ningiella sp. W23 TaxID=3023715 RepID=UPI003756A3FC
MNSCIPHDTKALFNQVKVEKFWWDGVQVNIPFHCIYAVIPNPVADHHSKINGFDVPVLVLGDYHVPIWDPMHKELKGMPKYAVVLTHQEGDKFGLYAYPADCMDESYCITYDEWFARQKTNTP